MDMKELSALYNLSAYQATTASKNNSSEKETSSTSISSILDTYTASDSDSNAVLASGTYTKSLNEVIVSGSNLTVSSAQNEASESSQSGNVSGSTGGGSGNSSSSDDSETTTEVIVVNGSTYLKTTTTTSSGEETVTMTKISDGNTSQKDANANSDSNSTAATASNAANYFSAI